jgi:hypothetical protein
MKCVQVVGQGIPVRLSNEDARHLVEVDHDGQYCPKSVWKQFHANNPVRPAHKLLPSGKIIQL